MIHEKKEIWKAAIKLSIQAMGPEWLVSSLRLSLSSEGLHGKGYGTVTLGCFDTKKTIRRKTVMPTPNHVPAVLGANQIFDNRVLRSAGTAKAMP